MAYYAFINEENIVVEVITGKNEDEATPEGFSNWEEYYETKREGLTCKRTSFNTYDNVYIDPLTMETGDDQSKAFRGNFAGIGYIWDEVNQIFFQPKPFASWVKNITKARWESPIGNEPELTAEQNADADNKYYYDWNESGQSWDLITVNIAEDNLRIQNQ